MFGTCCCFCNRSAGGHDDYEDEDDRHVEIADRNNQKLLSKSRREGSIIPVENSQGIQTWGLKRHPNGDKPMQWSFYTKRWDGRILYINYDEKNDQVVTSIWRPNLNRYFTLHPSLESGLFLIKISGREKYLCSSDKKLHICDSSGNGSNMVWELKFRSPAQVLIEVFAANRRHKWMNADLSNSIAVTADTAMNAWIYRSLGGRKGIFCSPVATSEECVSYSRDAADNGVFLETKLEQYEASFEWKPASERPIMPTFLETMAVTSGDEHSGKRYLKILLSCDGTAVLALTNPAEQTDAQEWNPVVAQFS